MSLNINTLENLNIKRVLERGSGKEIYRDESAILVLDEVSKAFMIACDDADFGMNVLEKNAAKDISLLFTSNKELGAQVFEKYGFTGNMECFQMAYLKTEIPVSNESLSFREATLEDFPFISAGYDLISDEELKEVISRRGIVVGQTDEGNVGFIGEHLEGSIGLLYVLPQHRRKGYAAELEKEMIRRHLSKGFIPFGQVEKTNEASMCLQESIGMTKSDNTVFWMWK